MTVSIIIVTHNSERYLPRCLAAFETMEPGTGEVILVDAGSSDQTREIAADLPVPVRRVMLRNVGFAAAANAGAAVARGEILLFLNPDTHPVLDAVLRLARTAADMPHAVVGAYLLMENAVPERWQNIPFPSLRRMLATHLGLLRDPSPVVTTAPVSVPWVSGGALALPRSLFERVGGFRETFFLYYEDVDLCRRVRQRGGTVLLHPMAQIEHQGGRSASRAVRTRIYDQSADRYFSLHRSWWEGFLLRLLRPLYRSGPTLALGGTALVLSVLVSITMSWMIGAMLGGLGLLLWASRWPRSCISLLASSLVAGQVLRIPVGSISLTLTDLLLPLALGAGLIAGIRRVGVWNVLRGYRHGVWLLCALAPGMLLALERLPAEDMRLMVLYALRLSALLALIPLLRILRVSFASVRTALVASGVVLALVGLGQLILFPSLLLSSGSAVAALLRVSAGTGWDPHEHRLFATWLDPNFLGAFFVIALGLLLLSPSQKQSRRMMMLVGCSVALLFLALLLTKSRSALAALLGMSVVSALMPRSRRIVGTLLVCGVLVFLLVPSLAARLRVDVAEDPTVRLRLLSWEEGLGHIARFPLFGMGYNAYPVEQRERGAIHDVAIHSRAGSDNGLVTLLATTGIWGATVLGIPVVLWGRRLLWESRKGSVRALALLASVLALLVHTQFVYSIAYIHLLLPLVLLASTHSDTHPVISSREDSL